VRSSIPPLAGYNVAVTADRRAEEQVALLTRRGATVIEGPTVRTLPLVDDQALWSAIDAVISDPPDVVVLLTGIGTRAMVGAAEGMGVDGELLATLARALVIARGPKAAGAAATAGIDVGWQTPGERSVEIVERLSAQARRGARIAVQRDGNSRALLAETLQSLGADVVDIPVYRWELPDDTRGAQRLIDAVLAGDVDAITFTSSPAVKHLLDIAQSDGHRDALLAAFAAGIVPVCVGPVCVETAERAGIGQAVVPNRARLGSMVQALVVHYAGRARVLRLRSSEVAIQGRAVFVDGQLTGLSARERGLLEVLADAGGAVVPKGRLLRDVWGPSFDDEHAVEVAVARLRRGLGSAGNAVETVPRRGYRLAA
jgi:uroporphyrinogen-III synthase